METIKHPPCDNVTIRCTEEEWFAKLEKEEQEARDKYANDPQAAALKLYETACHDTGGGFAASGFLLSLWNDNFSANMRRVLSSLDFENSAAVITLMTTLGPCHHLERYLTDDHIAQIIKVWGTTHERQRA